jgi:phosphoribosylformimino-5-aminoimidazole carboxamide ribotide isomerase
LEIIPVMDLMDGVVVRGVAGRREEYRPVQSLLATDARPLTVARAFRDKLQLHRIYLADLDGIQFGRPRYDLHRAIASEGFELYVDAGLREIENAAQLIGRMFADADVSGDLRRLPEPVHESEQPGEPNRRHGQVNPFQPFFSACHVDLAA